MTSALTTPIADSNPARLRGWSLGSLDRALWAISALALLLGVTEIAVGLTMPDVALAVFMFTWVFWIWTIAGVLAWWRRPRNAIGPLIIVGAVAVFLGGIANLGVPLLVFLGSVFATSPLAVAVHLLLAFPSGRLRGWASTATVVAAYLVAVGFDLFLALLPPSAEALVGVIRTAQPILGATVMLCTAVILIRRLIAADGPHRRVLLPLFAYGIVVVIAIPVIPFISRQLGGDGVVSGATQLALYAGLPVAFLIGVLVGGFTRTTALEALSAWLAISGASRPAVARALTTTLGDESLRVVYWVTERDVFVDERGAAVARIVDDADRGWIDVRVDERLVGAIDYDARIIGDPYAVRRAGEVLAIAIDRERLTTELLASNEELSKSRMRLVEAAYRERSRIARDLHDGLQVQLVLLALEAQTIANAPDASPATSAASEELRRGIDRAAADLRRLVHNVTPAALLEQGLVAAAEDLVDRLEMPASLDADVDEDALSTATTHTAYFVLAEVLANAVKHSRAATVRVRLRDDDGCLQMDVHDDGVGGAHIDGGTGLRGLVDRVDVLDGSIRIDSPRGGGTRVRVELPCE